MAFCLQDYVGLLGCGLPEPKSGLYLNDLPGMETELVQAITPKELPSFVQTWEKVQKRAWGRLQADVSGAMQQVKKLNFNTVVYQTRRLSLKRPSTLLPVTAGYVGVVIQAPFAQYGGIRLGSLEFYSATTGTTLVRGFDVRTGEKVYESDPVNVVIGFNAVEINKTLTLNTESMEVFVGMDATTLDLYENLQQDYYWYDMLGNGWDGCFCNPCHNDEVAYFHIRPASYVHMPLLGITNSLTTRLQTFGVNLRAEILCGIDSYLCENKHHFAQTWQYLCAAEMMKQKLGSYKLGFWANGNLEMTADLRTEYEADYKKYLNLTIQRIPVDENTICFNCNGVSGYRYDSLV
jgi:hypothetical protein